ncbi:MAG TPA: hypothetical protein VFQ22_06345, partial [Longimicrobiales bacterium]|nr:hypothetical protein [Longimicrobiales bacterium]
MTRAKLRPPLALALLLATAACAGPGDRPPEPADEGTTSGGTTSMDARLAQYATVRLTADLSHLSDPDLRVLRLLIEA